MTGGGPERTAEIAAKVEGFLRTVVVAYEREPQRDHHDCPTDASMMRTTCHLDGNRWVVNGRKAFTDADANAGTTAVRKTHCFDEARVAARAGGETTSESDYAFYVAFNFSRLTAIFHGTKVREARGTAASAHAKERAARFPAAYFARCPSGFYIPRFQRN